MPKKQPVKKSTSKRELAVGASPLGGDWTFLITGTSNVAPIRRKPPLPPVQVPILYSPNFAGIFKVRFSPSTNQLLWYFASNHQGNIKGGIPRGVQGYGGPNGGLRGTYTINRDRSTGTFDLVSPEGGTQRFSFALTNLDREIFLIYTGMPDEEVDGVVWAVGKKDRETVTRPEIPDREN